MFDVNPYLAEFRVDVLLKITMHGWDVGKDTMDEM